MHAHTLKACSIDICRRRHHSLSFRNQILIACTAPEMTTSSERQLLSGAKDCFDLNLEKRNGCACQPFKALINKNKMCQNSLWRDSDETEGEGEESQQDWSGEEDRFEKPGSDSPITQLLFPGWGKLEADVEAAVKL